MSETEDFIRSMQLLHTTKSERVDAIDGEVLRLNERIEQLMAERADIGFVLAKTATILDGIESRKAPTMHLRATAQGIADTMRKALEERVSLVQSQGTNLQEGARQLAEKFAPEERHDATTQPPLPPQSHLDDPDEGGE